MSNSFVICLVLLTTSVLLTTEAWFIKKGGEGSRDHDIDTGSGLTALYNQRVVRAQEVRRPLLNLNVQIWILYHTGVLVTTEKGERWLVHKGDEYGNASETVVVNARHMSSAWTYHRSKTIYRSTVGDYVKAGGPNYRLCCDNCQHARDRMMALN